MAADFQFTLDLVVANADLQGVPIRVGVLVMLDRDRQIVWQSDTGYPLQTWTLDNVAKDVMVLEATAIEHWPELAGACDWWVPVGSDMSLEFSKLDEGDRVQWQ